MEFDIGDLGLPILARTKEFINSISSLVVVVVVGHADTEGREEHSLIYSNPQLSITEEEKEFIVYDSSLILHAVINFPL